MIHILAIGINKEFIHKLEQEIKDIEIVLVPHFVKAIGYLYSNHFDLIFSTSKSSGMTPFKFLEVTKEIDNFILMIFFLDKFDDAIELRALSEGYDFVIKLNQDFNINKTYILKLIEMSLNLKGRTKLDLVANPITKEIRESKQTVKLSNQEFLIYHYLLQNQGTVCTRLELYSLIQDNKDPTPEQIQVVDVYIYRLRKKLNNDLIKSIRGKGYMID